MTVIDIELNRRITDILEKEFPEGIKGYALVVQHTEDAEDSESLTIAAQGEQTVKETKELLDLGGSVLVTLARGIQEEGENG